MLTGTAVIGALILFCGSLWCYCDAKRVHHLSDARVVVPSLSGTVSFGILILFSMRAADHGLGTLAVGVLVSVGGVFMGRATKLAGWAHPTSPPSSAAPTTATDRPPTA